MSEHVTPYADSSEQRIVGIGQTGQHVNRLKAYYMHVYIYIQVYTMRTVCTCSNIIMYIYICNSYITGPSFVADLLHRKSARAIARGLLRAINRLQNEGT